MMTSLMIFGAGGQLGSYAVDLALAKKLNVIGVNSNFDNIFNIVCDVASRERVDHAISLYKPDFLINYAAISSPRESLLKPNETFSVNYGGTLNILEAIRKHSPNTKALFVGSSEMFGARYSRRESFDDVVVSFQDEDTKFDPKTPYAASKVAAHYAVESYRKGYGLKVSNVIQFGAESERRSTKFVTRKVTEWIGLFNSLLRVNNQQPFFMSNAIAVGSATIPKLSLFKVKGVHKDWSHASDIVNAHFSILFSNKPKTYVVGSNEVHTLEQFLNLAFEHANLGDWTNYVVVEDPFAIDSNSYYCSDPSSIQKDLGWQRRISFNSLVCNMVDHDIETLCK